MRLNRVLVASALVAATGLGLAGCKSTRNALGMTKVTPDEFRVVSKAPLVVPPEYALRPPAPGEPRPQELQPESAARNALLGAREAQARSDGEKLLVAKAGADKVMFWKPGETTGGSAAVVAAAGDNVPAPVDPAAEEAKVKSLTGDKPVVISREKQTRIKLPGL